MQRKKELRTEALVWSSNDRLTSFSPSHTLKVCQSERVTLLFLHRRTKYQGERSKHTNSEMVRLSMATRSWVFST